MAESTNQLGRHHMWVDPKAKVFHIDLFGFYGVDEAEKFFVDYEKNATTLNKDEYSIVIDCQGLSTFKPDILPYLRDAYKAYAEFKSVSFINPQNPVGQMQLKRVARETNMRDKFQFVDDPGKLQL
ncbi:hypothetical protein SAMN04487895_10152 [Paenibacillus sophorae]|uniref:STAS domain-containing protein n=1 Tax=Paenibacillus sophorae TaxID=1333845 RepID=A0A1H8FAJ0_9BACL|nr:hypothetical protein [Paenibacillus sophorae]QWU13818.1 hypothetical protein KP014_17835 [Paenibacillus sophorae]SEN28823.1 hypothetical protein SAMN04487895_10152 [Paenibacillus sophorae]